MADSILSKFRKVSEQDVLELVSMPDDRQKTVKSKGSVARRMSIERGDYELGKRRRVLRWSGIKESLTSRKSRLDFDDLPVVESSVVHEAIKSRVRADNKLVLSLVDEMVFVLFDSPSVSVDDVRGVADKIIYNCENSDGVGVCSTLLEANDIILFANEQFGFVGYDKLRRERRLQSLRVSDELYSKIVRRLHGYVTDR